MRKLGSVIAPGGAVCITICPTLACNFECPYCFEDRGRGKMAPEIQDDIVRLAERMLDASKAKKLAITWFGGEPLMATDVIEALSKAHTRGRGAWLYVRGMDLHERIPAFGRRG